jgi:hypothetical protein
LLRCQCSPNVPFFGPEKFDAIFVHMRAN